MGDIGRTVWVDSHQSDEHGLVARVSLRMEDRSRKDCYFRGIQPWGYVHEDADIPQRDWIVDVEHGYESLFDDPLKRVTTTVPEKVNSRRDDDVLVKYVDESFEADLPMYRKLAVIDSISGYLELPEEPETKEGNIEVFDFKDVDVDPDTDAEIMPRVMIGDIEVQIGDETFEETRKNASQPINVICAYDNYEGDYSVFYYDKYDNLNNPGEIREIMEDQWDEEHQEYADVDIDLYSAPTEVDMLSAFIEYMNNRNFDLNSGWNWIDFDYEYIINRIRNLSESADISPHWLTPFSHIPHYTNNNQMQIPGRPAFDMMEAFCDKMTFTNWRSKALDYVANEEIGVGKVEDVDINWSWENHPEKLIAYNIVDVGLTVALDDANDIHGFFYEMGDISSIPIYDTFYEKRLIDGYVMSRRGDDEILPSADETELIENAGGYVADPVNGRKKDIGVSDLKSLYPSAIITWNISTETISDSPDEFDEYVKVPKVPEPKDVQGGIREEQIKWDWLYCSLEQEGLIPRTLKKLFDKRNNEKAKRNEFEADTPEYNKWDRKQAATKVIMNSMYGNASSKYWRLSNEYLGDAVTSTARYTLWKGRVSIEEMGYEAVYGDTDSHFIQLTEDTLEARVEELETISAKMDEDASTIFDDIYVSGDCDNCGTDGDYLYDEDEGVSYCAVCEFTTDYAHPFLEDSDLHGDEYTCMVWEPEKVYGVWMQLGKKKRYAGNIDWKEGTTYDEPKISISGFEFRRSDSMEVTAELQQETIEMILTDEGFDTVSEYLQSIIDQIDEDHEDVKKFALPGSINKDLDDYPNRQVPRASIYSNEHLGYEFGEGDNPFVYLVESSPSNLPNTDVLALEWNEGIPDGFELDKEAIIERGIRKPIAPIIEEVGWTFDELRSGREQQELGLGGGGENPFA